jgi:hypothetical protein
MADSTDSRAAAAWKKYDACVKKYTHMGKSMATKVCKPKRKAAQKLGPRK